MKERGQAVKNFNTMLGEKRAAIKDNANEEYFSSEYNKLLTILKEEGEEDFLPKRMEKVRDSSDTIEEKLLMLYRIWVKVGIGKAVEENTDSGEYGRWGNTKISDYITPDNFSPESQNLNTLASLYESSPTKIDPEAPKRMIIERINTIINNKSTITKEVLGNLIFYSYLFNNPEMVIENYDISHIGDTLPDGDNLEEQ